MPNQSNLAIDCQNLLFSWPKQPATLSIEQFSVKKGEHLFIQGASGSGKSTLLNLLTGVLSPQKGEIKVLGQDLNSMSNAQKDRFRAKHLGIVFQQFNLLPYFNAIENIELALNVSQKSNSRTDTADNSQRINALLTALGINQETAHQPSHQLSIGQQQRVAVARALISKPDIVIADEPTSALDSDSRDRFMQELFALVNETQATLIFVSHDKNLQRYFSHHINLCEINKAGEQN